MPKFDIQIEGTFNVEISKNFKLVADNEEDATVKVLKLFNKFLESFPFRTTDLKFDDLDISQLPDDDDSLVYENDQYNQFVSDMENAGLEVRNYRGRFWYNGPAVKCDDPSEVISKTAVPCQWDSMGLGYIVYPK